MLERAVVNAEIYPSQERVLRVLTDEMFDGRGGRVSPSEAGLRAADWFDGYAIYQRPLLRHVLFVTGAPLPYFQAARTLTPEERAAVEAGQASLCSFTQRRCKANVVSIVA